MSFWAICACQNEVDIIGDTLCHILDQGAAHVIVSDGMSTDGTREKIAWVESLYPERVTLLDDTEPYFYQAKMMNELAALAGQAGADWIVPFDADEFWACADPRYTLAEALDDLNRLPDIRVVYASMYQYMDRDNRWLDPKPLPKVAFRWDPAAQLTMGNHDVSGPGERCRGPLIVREIQFRGRDHYHEKVRARIRTLEPGLPQSEAGHYRRLDGMTTAQLDAEWAALCDVPTIYDPIP